MITLTGIARRYGGRTLFEDVSLQLDAGHRYGLVGANGAGKTTLLRMLSGEEACSAGEIAIPKSARLGVLAQDAFRYDELPILDVAMMGDGPVWQAQRAQEAMLEGPEADFDEHRFAALEEQIAALNGYSLPARAAEILEGLGIPTALHRQPLRTLSGGYKLRAMLAATLVGRPDVLLLDEPTNHLDIVSIGWLEKFLQGFAGCAVIVSHDHQFLDGVCTDILDVDYERILSYRGDYTAFVAAKAGTRARLEAEIARRQAEIADKEAWIARFKAKATKARQANSRAKQVEKMDLPELPRSSRAWPTFKLAPRRSSGREVLTVKGMWKSYGQKLVLADVSFAAQRGERIAVVGANGIGKSTLLKILVETLAADEGEARWGHEAHIGWFPQDHREALGEAAKDTVLEWMWRCCPAEGVGFVRGKLAEVLFSQDDVHKRVGALSGGESARLLFARLGVQQPNVLVLDEPTNHLDLESTETLAAALRRYEGTLLFVSHNRWFVSQLATRVLELTTDGLRDYPGTWEEYLRRRGADHLDRSQVAAAARQAERAAKQERKAPPPVAKLPPPASPTPPAAAPPAAAAPPKAAAKKKSPRKVARPEGPMWFEVEEAVEEGTSASWFAGLPAARGLGKRKR